MAISPDSSTLTSPLADAVVRTPISATPIYAPFTILIDSAEQQPFTFTGLRADSSKKYAPLIVRTEVTSLGRYPNSLGDYCIAGYERRCHLERKSLSDGTIDRTPSTADMRPACPSGSDSSYRMTRQYPRS